MRLQEFIDRLSTHGSLKVRSAINPLLWLIGTLGCFLTGSLFAGAADWVVGILLALLCLAVVICLVTYCLLAWKRPEDLRSEQYLMRRKGFQCTMKRVSSIRQLRQRSCLRYQTLGRKTMTNRPLLIVFNPDQVSDAAFRNFLESSVGYVSYWAQVFPNSIFVRSSIDANAMSSYVHGHFPQLQFFISDVSEPICRDGFMPEGVWNLIYQSSRVSDLAS